MDWRLLLARSEAHVAHVFCLFIFEWKGLGHPAFTFPNCHLWWGPHNSVILIIDSWSSVYSSQFSSGGGVRTPLISGRKKNLGKEKNRSPLTSRRKRNLWKEKHGPSPAFLTALSWPAWDNLFVFPLPSLCGFLDWDPALKSWTGAFTACKESRAPGMLGVEFQGIDINF